MKRWKRKKPAGRQQMRTTESEKIQKKTGTLSDGFKPKYLIASVCFALCFTFFLVTGGVIYDRDLLPNLTLLKESGKVFYLSPLIFLFVTGILYFVFLLLEKKIPKFRFLPGFCQNPFVPAAVYFFWFGVVLLGIVFAVLFRKHFNKILLFGAVIVIGFLLVDKALFGIMGFAGADTKEMLSVPIQQIGRAYTDHAGDFTNEELEGYDRYIGLEYAPYYCPHISDPLKKNFKTEEVKKDPGAFVSYWLKLGKKYPESYFLSYVSMYSPYWYVWSKSFDIYSVSPYVETFITEDGEFSFQRKGFLPGLNAVFETVANRSENPLLSRGLPLWITLASLFFAVVLKPVLALAPVLVFGLFNREDSQKLQ